MLGLIITLIVIGILLYVINTYIPMDEKIKNILNIVVVLIVIFWLLNIFGILNYVGNVSVPRIK